MSADAISGIIENNKARMTELEEQKEVYNQAITDSLDQKHSIWLQMCSFLSKCGTSNPMHLNVQQKTMYNELLAGYFGANKSYNKAYFGYLSANSSLFNLVLDNGKLEASQIAYNNFTKNYKSNG